MATKIEWTDETWNPVTGCTPISPGCANCYARRMATRLAGRFGYPEAPHQFDVTLRPERLEEPLKWRKPRRVFVCSMSDLFHEDVPFEFVVRIWQTMFKAKDHIFQILTKRPVRMSEFMNLPTNNLGTFPVVLPNIWLGVTVCTQEETWKIGELLQIPAAVRFVSIEPMVGEVDMCDFLPHLVDSGALDPNTGAGIDIMQPGIDWVICGGETGPNARPMHPDWVRSLRDQCQCADVPFFFKQWGEWSAKYEHVLTKSSGERAFAKMDYPGCKPLYFARVGKKNSGRELDGQLWEQFPQLRTK